MKKVDSRKYAIAVWALARARGALYSAVNGEITEAQVVLDATSLRNLAERFGYEESELAVDWAEFLRPDETFIPSEGKDG